MSFSSLPQDIIALILQSCDSFSQIRSLILTSKPIHSVWILNQHSILWYVGQEDIPGFSDALIATRATQIAKDALLKGELPTDPFPVAELSGDAHKPSLEELKQTQCLQSVAEYLENETLDDDPDSFACMPDSSETERHEWARLRWKVWREEYHRAIYRNIAAGAILYRTYHTPIVSSARPASFLAALIRIMEGSEDLEAVTDDWFSGSDRRYLSDIPLYSRQDYRRSEASFQPLEDLFVEESRKRALSLDSSNKISSIRLEVRGEKSLFSSFERYTKTQNPQSLGATHAEALFDQILHFIFTTEQKPQQFIWDPREAREEPSEETDSSISAIFFGSFAPINLTLRDKMDVSGVLALPGLESKTLQNSNYLGFQYMDTFLNQAWEVGGIPNYYARDRRPPAPRVYFAEHMLRKYFGLRFADTIYASTRDSICAWDAFTHYGGLFTNLALEPYYLGEDMLQSCDDPVPTPYFKSAYE
ncbi:hypothetical protein FE257_013081 [Aspergillus nanangensis]|uniref:F-box domain-containing protein n=1 Tax=Aspergillus nanangensis TaxID=2582783 RepID=A0AAD4GRC6_ASPNN|nr:hypothetical protein FE257_013081 [Aspergillus nanangensis]